MDRTRHEAPLVDRKAEEVQVNVDACRRPQRLGFLNGEIDVPCDFDRMHETEIAALFGVEPGTLPY